MSLRDQFVPVGDRLAKQQALLGAVPKRAVDHDASGIGVRDLDLADIKLDQSAQPRESLNNDRIAEYAEAMKAGDQFPLLTVFFDGETYWLADGFHRHYAAQHAGRKQIRCDVRRGGLRDAILWSVGANAKHGLARSDADRERAILRLLNDAEWSTWTDRDIAKRCRVSHPYVARIRAKHAADTGNVSSMDRTFVHPKTGKPTTMKTAGINAGRKNAPKALDNDEPSPEAGPQAEASLAGTGTGSPADREGRIEGEAASVGLPAYSDEDREVEDLQKAWDRAGEGARSRFLVANGLKSYPETGENHASYSGQRFGRSNDEQHDAPPVQGALGCREGADDRDQGQGPRIAGADRGVRPVAGTVERQDEDGRSRHVGGQARHEITQSDGGAIAEVKGKARLANAAGVDPSPSETNPQPASSQQVTADSPVPNSSPASGAFPLRPAKPLRPHCLNPNLCAGSGKQHCHACTKAMGEAA